MKSLSAISTTIFLMFSTASIAQSSFTVVEASTGVMAVQGEMQDHLVGINEMNSVTTLAIHTRAYKSKRVSFGGSVSFYTTYMNYTGDKGWLEGHSTNGVGFNPQLSTRILLTGRDDMRFMKHAFVTYLELGAGAHVISNRSTYPPNTDFTKVPVVEGENDLHVAPSVGMSLGFRYFIGYDWGITFRCNGQYINSDYVDGIVGITGTKDYQWSSTIGMMYAF